MKCANRSTCTAGFVSIPPVCSHTAPSCGPFPSLTSHCCGQDERGLPKLSVAFEQSGVPKQFTGGSVIPLHNKVMPCQDDS